MFRFFKKTKSEEEAIPQDEESDSQSSGEYTESQNLSHEDEGDVPSESCPVIEQEEYSWFSRLYRGLSKTRQNLSKKMATLLGGGHIDEQAYEALETILLSSDVGLPATEYLLGRVRDRVSLGALKDRVALKEALKEELVELLLPLQQRTEWSQRPHIILVVGVNGAGKTTSIGKLAHKICQSGLSLLLAAGDTFRAAAKEQLEAWGERNQVRVVSQMGGDSAAVCFDAVHSAQSKHIDVVLADTAGRLPTQLHLMDELKKIKRVMQKTMPEAPHDVFLVLDANTGQNTVTQVKAFHDALGLTGLVLTKLDGTAKGGCVAAIAQQCPVPVRYIGVGETLEDLREFDARDYVTALFD